MGVGGGGGGGGGERRLTDGEPWVMRLICPTCNEGEKIERKEEDVGDQTDDSLAS